MSRRAMFAAFVALAAALPCAALPLGLRLTQAAVIANAKNDTPDSYVQDGLVAMWDGEWNAGRGVHDASATTWVDLTGNGNDLAMPSSAAARWQADRAEFGYDGATGGFATAPLPDAIGQGKTVTVEAICCPEKFGIKAQSRIVISANICLSWRNFESSRGFLASSIIDGSSRCLFEYYYGTPAEVVAKPNTLSVSASTQTASAFYGSCSVYCNGRRIAHNAGRWEGASTFGGLMHVGSENPSLDGATTFWNVRIYNRQLTAEEVAHNYAIDRARFGSGE